MLFDYDSATLRDDGRAAASRNADYLKRWPSVRITVEGHADTRGTSEYNLALGERRAAAVKDYSSAWVCRPIGSRRSARARNSPCAPKRTRRAGSATGAGFTSLRLSNLSGARGRGVRGIRIPSTSHPLPLSSVQHLRQFLLRHSVFRRLSSRQSAAQESRGRSDRAARDRSRCRFRRRDRMAFGCAAMTRWTSDFISSHRWQPGLL